MAFCQLNLHLIYWRSKSGMTLAAALRMLTLTFFEGADTRPVTSMTVSDLRVTGGAIWNPTQYGLLASYCDGAWKHRRQRYSRLAVTGGGCLLFGITREPTIVSDSIDHFYFIGPTLSANGVAIAKYIEKQDTWHGLVRPMWWTAMRIVSSQGVSALVDQSQVVLLNPWEPCRSCDGVGPVALSDSDVLRSGANEPNPQLARH